MHDGERPDFFPHDPVNHREGKATTQVAPVWRVEDRADLRVVPEDPEDAFHFLKEIETESRGLGFVES